MFHITWRLYLRRELGHSTAWGTWKMASAASFLSRSTYVEGRPRTWPQVHLASLARFRHFTCQNYDYMHIAMAMNSNVRVTDVLGNRRISLFSDRSLKSNRAKTSSSPRDGVLKSFLLNPLKFQPKDYMVKALEDLHFDRHCDSAVLDLWEVSISSFPLADKTLP